jgi:hypothetical protein
MSSKLLLPHLLDGFFIPDRSCFPRSAGNWLFRFRRWLDPADSEDAAALIANLDCLCALFPAISSALATCGRDGFIRAIGEVVVRWGQVCGRGRDSGTASSGVDWPCLPATPPSPLSSPDAATSPHAHDDTAPLKKPVTAAWPPCAEPPRPFGIDGWAAPPPGPAHPLLAE